MKLKSHIPKSIGWIGSAVIAAGLGYWIGRDHEHRDRLDARDDIREKRSFTDLRGALEGHERPDDLGPDEPPGPPGTGAAGAAAATTPVDSVITHDVGVEAPRDQLEQLRRDIQSHRRGGR